MNNNMAKFGIGLVAVAVLGTAGAFKFTEKSTMVTLGFVTLSMAGLKTKFFNKELR